MPDGKEKLNSDPREMITVAVNRSMTYLGVLTVAVAIFAASFQPQPALFPAISSFLSLCAFFAMGIALMRVQSLNAPVFTYWDLAAVWLFIAIGIRLVTDVEAFEAYLAQVSATAPAETAPAVQAPSDGATK